MLVTCVTLRSVACLFVRTDLNKLRFTSAAALVCITYTTLLIVGNFLAADSYSDSVKTFHVEQGVFASLPVANVAFTLHYNAPRCVLRYTTHGEPCLGSITSPAVLVPGTCKS